MRMLNRYDHAGEGGGGGTDPRLSGIMLGGEEEEGDGAAARVDPPARERPTVGFAILPRRVPRPFVVEMRCRATRN